jgi:redox-sensitive bicupin YhaK (pirin superfamily)
MTAGSGIVHSERTSPENRASGGKLFGLQTWVALPKQHEETDPGFSHHKAHDIPFTEDAGARLTVIAGSSDGLTSPVKTFSDMVYADIALQDGARYQLKAEHIERAIYVVGGEVEVIGQTGGFATNELIIFKPGAEIVLRARGAARLMLLGGEPLSEQRHIFWNFVSSSPERLEQAKADWKAQRFAAVPHEHDYIPLPE